MAGLLRFICHQDASSCSLEYDYEEEQGELELARGLIDELDVGPVVTPRLPVMEHRDTIIDTIAHHNLFLIQGSTGCGKTTKVGLVHLLATHHVSW